MSIPALYRAVSLPGGVNPDKSDALGSNGVKKQDSTEFQNLLRDRLKLSQHAEARIRSRSLEWSPELEERIQGAMELAQTKGSREALILADNVAVIANVESKTVVTAMDRSQLSKGRIFTNIDSAVLA